MPLGSIHIAKLSADPQVYAVWFTPYLGANGPRAHRRCESLGDLGVLLDDLGIRDQRAPNALRDAYRDANATVTNVDVTHQQLWELGLEPT